jgi:replicative DNA helicase
MNQHDTADQAGDSVLGTLIRYYKPELIVLVQVQGVRPQDWFRDRQRVLWRAILALHGAGRSVDEITLKAFLQKHGMSDRVTDGYLACCVAGAVPSALKDHAWLVAESGRWDRLMRAHASVQRAIEARDDDALRDAVALVRRDVLPEEGAPKLTVVKEAAA